MTSQRRTPFADYLAVFHAEHAGITERILARCRSDGMNPYDWCVEALAAAQNLVVDVACGSGPMHDRTAGWTGTDLSESELRRARNLRRGPLTRSAAIALPFRSQCATAVVCTMSLQLIEPVPVALGEIARVLGGSGRVVLLLPSKRPLPILDAARYLLMQAALRRRIAYPNDRALRPGPLADLAAECGLRVVEDQRRAFELPLDSEDSVNELIDSLYLPGVDERPKRRATKVLSLRTGDGIAIPLRRVVLEPSR